MAELSAYELERLSNIQRNQSVLAVLGLDKPKVTPAPKVAKPKFQRSPIESSRKSSRIAALPPTAVYVESELSNGKVVLAGADANEVAAKSRTPEVVVTPDEPTDEDLSPDNEDQLFLNEVKVYALLREEKNGIARELDTPAYHVAQNRALMAMVRCVPSTHLELLTCWGWGEAKASAHGSRLLAVLAPYAMALRKAKNHRPRHATESDDEDAPLSLRCATEPPRHATESDDEDAPLSLRCATEPEVIEIDDDAPPANVLGPLPTEPSDLKSFEQAAFEAMLAWKRARAQELGYSDPCIICHNRTLCELVRLLPASRSALGAVWGIGPKRNDQHGDLMLAALRPFRAGLLDARLRPAATPDVAKAATNATKRGRTDATDAQLRHRKWIHAGSSTWCEEAGEGLAAVEWRTQHEARRLPACDWAERRGRCVRVNGCEACSRYVANGKPFDYAVMSQRLLDMIASPGAYGSHAAAHAAGWRWNASPNHDQSSHAHQWWPPQAAVYKDEKLPLGTYAAIRVIEGLF